VLAVVAHVGSMPVRNSRIGPRSVAAARELGVLHVRTRSGFPGQAARHRTQCRMAHSAHQGVGGLQGFVFFGASIGRAFIIACVSWYLVGKKALEIREKLNNISLMLRQCRQASRRRGYACRSSRRRHAASIECRHRKGTGKFRGMAAQPSGPAFAKAMRLKTRAGSPLELGYCRPRSHMR
jgi:hypothetical protein